MGARVLVVDRADGWPADDLGSNGWVVERASSRHDVLSALATDDVDCVVVAADRSDADQPGTAAGEPSSADDSIVDPLDAVETVRTFGRELPVVLASADPDGDLAAAATRRGVTEYYTRSSIDESLAERVERHLTVEAPAGTADGGTTGPDGNLNGDDGVSGAVDLTGRDDEFQVSIEETAKALDAVEDGVYVLDPEGRFVVVNESLSEMTGYAPDELVGADSGLILDDESFETALEAVDELVWGEESETTVPITIEPKDDDPFPAEDHSTVVTEDGEFAGLAGVIRDVTEKRERTHELERYESILGAIDDGVYALDEEGRFDVVNDALAALTGYDREELLGEHTSVIKSDETVERAEDKLRSLLRDEAVETTFELDLRPKSGDPIEAEDHMTMLTDDDGDFDGTAGVIRDISDRKERERELRAARERFAELLETSRALMGAHTRERVADIVVDAVSETMGYDLSVVRLYDHDSDSLTPVAGSENDALSASSRPDYAPGEGGPGRAFEAGEIRHYPEDFAAGTADPPEPIVETLYVPLGDRGAVSIGATERGAFDERDRSLAEILSANAAVALDRVAHEDELLQYRIVLENVQDMVYVLDDAGRFSLVTQPLADWLGYDRADIVGAPVEDVLDDADELAAFDSLIAEMWYGDGDNRTRETQITTAEGETLPATIEVSLLPADDEFAGSVGVVRDRSELIRTREQLETQRDRFTYLFDNLPDAVVEASLDGGDPVVTSVNDAFTDVFGYDAAAITGEPLNDYILPADERDDGERLDRRAAAGEVVQREVRRRTAGGYRDFLFRGVPYDAAGDGTNSFGIYTDITEQKERERRLKVLNRVLRHNLRNDLNVVLGYAEMITERVEDEQVDEWAETLIDTAAEVASLGDRARSLDRTMRRGSLRDHSVALRSLVDDVAADYRGDFPDATIETDVDDVTVVGDSRLELALSELFENSVEYGGDAVSVRVTARREGGRVTLRVADDGPGIPDYERAVVDESSEITQLEHGSGLGLWVVRWVCESCGGRLGFEESDMGGTAVVLSLTPDDDE